MDSVFFSFHINYTGRAYNFWEIHIKEGWPRLMCVQCKVPRVDHYRDNFSIFVFFSGNEMHGISISMGRKNRNKMLEYDIWIAHFVRHLEFTVYYSNKKVNEMSSLRQHRICVLGISTLGNLLVKVSYHPLHKVLRTEINTRSSICVWSNLLFAITKNHTRKPKLSSSLS